MNDIPPLQLAQLAIQLAALDRASSDEIVKYILKAAELHDLCCQNNVDRRKQTT